MAYRYVHWFFFSFLGLLGRIVWLDYVKESNQKWKKKLSFAIFLFTVLLEYQQTRWTNVQHRMACRFSKQTCLWITNFCCATQCGPILQGPTLDKTWQCLQIHWMLMLISEYRTTPMVQFYIDNRNRSQVECYVLLLWRLILTRERRF